MLLVPGLVFLFLHSFGENQYTIPVYYAESNELPETSCENISVPYSLSRLEYSVLGGNLEAAEPVTSADWLGSAVLIAVLPPECNLCAGQAALSRVTKAVAKKNNLQLFAIDTSEPSSQKVTSNNFQTIKLAGEPLEIFRCKLLIPEVANGELFRAYNQLVLLDSQQRIRGYYQAEDRKEVDRLIQEIQILNQENNG
jgi:protein SCO1/2